MTQTATSKRLAEHSSPASVLAAGAGGRTSQTTLTFGRGGLECSARGVDVLGVEYRPIARGVGRGQLDTVFTHAGDELRERGFACRAAEAAAASAFLQRFLELRAAYSLRERESGTSTAKRAALAGGPGTGRRTIPRRRRQCDSLFGQARSHGRESSPAGCLSAFRRCAGARGRSARGGGARRAAGASACRQSEAAAEHRQRCQRPEPTDGCGFGEAGWVHGFQFVPCLEFV
jgi:hypothetical protein